MKHSKKHQKLKIRKVKKNLFLLVTFCDTNDPYNPPQSSLKQLGIEGRYHLSPPHNYFIQIKGIRSSYVRNFPPSYSNHLKDMYDGCLRWIDTNLEKLLLEVEENLGKDTYVIVTSTHGQELGDYRCGNGQAFRRISVCNRAHARRMQRQAGAWVRTAGADGALSVRPQSGGWSSLSPT